jgi:hypothetical protein
MKINNEGFPEIEIYGLKIRSSEDQRIEIDVRQRGINVDRIYIEFNLDEGYAHIYSHNGEVDQKMPFSPDHFSNFAAASLGRKGGSVKSEAKKKSGAENMAKARAARKQVGWPKGKPRKPTK